MAKRYPTSHDQRDDPICKEITNKINRAFGDSHKEETLNFKKGGAIPSKACQHKEGLSIKIKHPGALHEELGIPEDKKISSKKINSELKKAKADDEKTLEKRLVFAKNARKWKH